MYQAPPTFWEGPGYQADQVPDGLTTTHHMVVPCGYPREGRPLPRRTSQDRSCREYGGHSLPTVEVSSCENSGEKRERGRGGGGGREVREMGRGVGGREKCGRWGGEGEKERGRERSEEGKERGRGREREVREV